MSIYNQRWLSRFIDPQNQPDEIKRYVEAENRFLLENITSQSRLVDFGCGFGRHLQLLADRLIYGLGIDINEEDVRLGYELLRGYLNLELRVADARNTRIEETFDFAICMNNTLGNIEEREKVISEMRRVVLPSGLLLIGVYAENSVIPRIEWYQRTGLTIQEVTEDYILTDHGFKSYHFSIDGLIRLLGKCQIEPVGRIGYLITTF